MTITNVTNNGATPLISQGNGKTSYLILNRAIANELYIGDDSSIAGGNVNSCSLVDPLGFQVVTDAQDWYGLCANQAAGAFCAVDITPNSSAAGISPVVAAEQIALSVGTFSTAGLALEATLQDTNTTLGAPAQDLTVGGLATSIPTNISTTGVPLLANSTVLSNPGNMTFTPGLADTLGPFTLSQISYEIGIRLQANAAETFPYMQVTLQWNDTASGVLICNENYYLGIGSGGLCRYKAVGRAKGDSLTVILTWNGTVATTAARVVITNSSRIYIRDDFRSQSTFNGIVGVASGTYDIDGSIILGTAPNIGAGNSVMRSLPLYVGTVRLSSYTQTGAASIAVLSVGQAQIQGLSDNGVYALSLGTNVVNTSQFDLPRGQCVLEITNLGGAAQNIGATIVISEQDT